MSVIRGGGEQRRLSRRTRQALERRLVLGHRHAGFRGKIGPRSQNGPALVEGDGAELRGQAQRGRPAVGRRAQSQL